MASAASAIGPKDAAAAARCRPAWRRKRQVCPPQRSPGAAGSGEGAGRAMARGPGRAGSARRGLGQRRLPTWEISDSDAEGPAGAETSARARDPAEERRPAAEALRRLRPGQAVRRLAVLVDPAVLEDASADTLMEALHALGCEPRAEPQRPARSLRWSRASPDPCPRGVCGPTCSVPWVTPESPACLHLAVIGLDAYLWSQKPSAQETQQPEHPAVTRAEAAVGWPEVEEALVRLQLWANVDVLLVASWQELSQHVCAFTKALAQRPFKQARESGAFPFCTSGRWAAGEQVARDGTGLRRAWWRQVRQFNRVSPAVADAIVSAFPSPRLLQQAYVACGTEQERLSLLADLPVKTGKGAPPRRVGPDLSRRVCLFLTTTDPDLLLDLGS
ncbi:probable crossover junction endonuclease EME2 isoform X2 [Bubalus kerabau]|uniref:probable crossover junction endonuclease EME2 isoform X2 n=1 Tax=Bubalus carabanensis TaxID=3119969 RepID=UPI00244EEB7D|nr:probable crossover junction endonuclease EME2 isoform X2 [Bubalus carabanensis]